MRIYDIIKKKRDGGELSKEEIEFFVGGVADGSVCDYQASALCMAIYINGMTERETADLTLAMANSGDTVDLSRFGNNTVDKHSTGGVGDKTTLIIAPIVASLGCVMAKMSGRGLGHTGGTIDKLESIEGFNTELTPDEFFSLAEQNGVAVVGQSGNLTPADKKLYALRDVTATVDSLPLIASSVMSKKLAAGSHTIVLDVKCGSGAFMKTPQQAKELAEAMVKIGNNCGRKTAAVITDMDKPLGYGIGNSIEVIEAIEVLKGGGPEDLKEVCLTLSSQAVSLCKNIGIDKARELCEESLYSGKAFEKFKIWITSQGGNGEWIENTSLFPKADYEYRLYAEKDGCVNILDAEKIGAASVILGAGRVQKGDKIDMTAGIVLNKKHGDKVEKGELTATFYSCNRESFDSAKEKFLSAFEITENQPEKTPLVFAVI